VTAEDKVMYTKMMNMFDTDKSGSLKDSEM